MFVTAVQCIDSLSLHVAPDFILVLFSLLINPPGWALRLVPALETVTHHDHHRGCERVPGQRAEVQGAAEEMLIIGAVCRPERVRRVTCVCVCVLKLQRLTGETSITGKICVFKFSRCSQGNTSLSKLQKLTDLWSFSCRCSLSYVFWGVCHDAVRNSEPVQKNLPSDYSASVFAYKTSLTMFWQKENPTSWTASKLLKGHSGNWIIYVHKQ